jgi:hypothetical protein
MPFPGGDIPHLILWAHLAVATFHLRTPNGSNFIWCAAADVDTRMWVASVVIHAKVGDAPNVIVVSVSVQEAYFINSGIALMTIDIISWFVLSIRATTGTNCFATPEATCKAVCRNSALT